MVATSYYAAALCGLGCTAAANSGDAFDNIKASTELDWSPCGTNFFCAKLQVPLDYKNPNKGHAAVPLLKYAAANHSSSDGPYQGMIVVIPGGPGGSGVDLLRSNGTAFQSVVGSNWDLVSFDPRGMFRSEPRLDCALNASSTPVSSAPGYGEPRDTVPRLDDDTLYNPYLRYGKALGERCAQRSGGDRDAGPHMSTAIVARDLRSITDAYACSADGRRAARNSSLLNFYGISYGTVIGQTFASMFPERVGNAVLDGVVSPQSYVDKWIPNSINHLDGVLALFFISCSKAGPSVCPYATGSSARDTFARFKASLKRLDARRAKAEHWSNATDIGEALLTLKAAALNAAYTPLGSFSTLAPALVSLEAALNSGKLKQWSQQIAAATRDPGPAGDENDEYVMGVLCSDENNHLYGKTLSDLQPLIKSLEAQSIIGEIWMKNALECTGWKIKSNDIFTGPFGGKTATPMLFVSNTYDPVSPIENSRSGAPRYKRAQILTVDGMGHVTATIGNKCAFAKLKAYFQNTQLPGNDNFCALESVPFDAKLSGTLQDNIQKAGLLDLHF